MPQLPTPACAIQRDDGQVVLTAGSRSQLLSGTIASTNDDAHILIGPYASLGRNITFDMEDRASRASAAAYPFSFWSPSPAEDVPERRQIIIGNDVPIFYNDFTAVSGIEGVSKEAAKSAAKSNQNPLQRVMATLPLLKGIRRMLQAIALTWIRSVSFSASNGGIGRRRIFGRTYIFWRTMSMHFL